MENLRDKIFEKSPVVTFFAIHLDTETFHGIISIAATEKA